MGFLQKSNIPPALRTMNVDFHLRFGWLVHKKNRGRAGSRVRKNIYETLTPVPATALGNFFPALIAEK
jgi:hypothetical protein